MVDEKTAAAAWPGQNPARAKLLAAESFTVTVLSVRGVAANVTWPIHFEAVYDESTQTYRFTYSGFGGH